MGICKYCGEDAGFLRKKHKECERKYLEGKNAVIDIIHNAFISKNITNMVNNIKEICDSSYIKDFDKKLFISTGWEKSIDTAFEDDLVSEEEENLLCDILEKFSLTQYDVNNNGYYTKLIKGTVIRTLINGEIPNKITIEGNLPFNFQKNESLIWIFQNVDYIEQKTKTHYVGCSSGFSIRIAKGVYYRTGAFKGERIQTEQSLYADTGILAITNKNLYFGGSRKNFRINFNKIVSFIPYSDGLGVHKDGVSAKPQTFITGDGWFIYNLVSNISNLNQ
ncbi:MAG: hypothetical protein AB7U85_06740 [Alphaproteobacteria bacterium]